MLDQREPEAAPPKTATSSGAIRGAQASSSAAAPVAIGASADGAGMPSAPPADRRDPLAAVLRNCVLARAARFAPRPEAGPRPGDADGGRLPAALLDGIAIATGEDLSDVRVHAGSPRPAAIGALAFARGSEIHLGTGQEHLLEHEAWHVVQQRAGQVESTGRLVDGTPVNTDRELEREADAWRVRPARRPRVAPPADRPPSQDVLQGVFTYRGQPAPDQPHFWEDLDSGRLYKLVKAGPPDEQTGQTTWAVVERADGFRVSVRMADATGGWVLADVETDELRGIRLGAVPYVRPQTARPTLVPTDDYEMTVTEHDRPQPQFVEGEESELPDYQDQAKEQLTEKGMRVARLGTQLTVQVTVVPAAQGQARADESVPPDFVYTAGQVYLAGVAVGDKDRANTYLDPKPATAHKKASGIPQGKHTVAWALIRRWIAALSNKSVGQGLDAMIDGIEAMRPLLRGDEPQHLLGTTKIVLDENKHLHAYTAIRNAALPIDRWQANVSDMLRLYVQLYHLCAGALFAGSSTQRGEADAVAAFLACEEALAAGTDEPYDVDDLRRHATKLVEVNFTIPAASYAFAMSHFIDVLAETYPRVMHKHGAEIVAPLLDKSVSAKYPQTWNLGNVATVRDLLAHFRYVLADFATVAATAKVSGELSVTPFQLTDHPSHFVANVGLAPIGQGAEVQYTVTQGSASTTLNVRAYQASEIVVGGILLSDKDRPQTPAGKTQHSHTVAWTLIRHGIMAYQHASLNALLHDLRESFTDLADDVASTQTEGHAILAKAHAALVDVDTQVRPLHDWQTLASLLVTWYVVAYHLARSATVHDPRTARPDGHAEAVHRDVLERNERRLVNTGKLYNSPNRVVEAGCALFDAYTASAATSVPLSTAYEHWLSVLRRTYPNVMAVGETAMIASIQARNISWPKSPIRLKDVLTTGL